MIKQSPRVYLYKITFEEVRYAGRAFLNGRGEKNHRYGTKWWNNGFENKLQQARPGPEWIKGIISKKEIKNA